MTEKIRQACVIILIMFIALVASSLSSSAEEPQKPALKAEESVEEYEEYTMLEMMEYLMIPRRAVGKISLSDKVEYIDNYFFQKEKDETTDSRFSNIIAPSIYLKYPMGRTYLEGRYDYDFTYYITHGEIAHRHNANVKLYHRPTRRLSVGLSDTFNRSDYAVQETTVDTPVGGRTITTNVLNGETVYELTRRLRTRLWGNYSILDFKEEAEGNSGDHEAAAFGSGVGVIADPRSTIWASYGLRKTWFEKLKKKSSANHIVRLNFNRKVQKKFDVTVGGGYNFLHYDTGEEVRGFTADTDLKFFLSKFTDIDFAYAYGFTDSVKEDFLVYRSHTVKAAMRHTLTPRISMDAEIHYLLAYYDRDFEIKKSPSDPVLSDTKNSKTFGAQANMNYKISRIFDVGATYNVDVKFSDFEQDDYFANKYLVYVKAEF